MCPWKHSADTVELIQEELLRVVWTAPSKTRAEDTHAARRARIYTPPQCGLRAEGQFEAFLCSEPSG
jgi:hypothetical protein